MPRIAPGDRVRQKHNGTLATVLEVAAGGTKLRYDSGGPYGERGRHIGVWEHLIDVELDTAPGGPMQVSK